MRKHPEMISLIVQLCYNFSQATDNTMKPEMLLKVLDVISHNSNYVDANVIHHTI